MGDAGFEHPPLALSKTPILQEDGAKSGAQRAPKSRKKAQDQPSYDPDLAEIVNRWPRLPEHIKAAIKTLATTAESKEVKP